MKKDPVCGTVFDVLEATVVSRYRRRYYYFCSLRCRDAFVLAPRCFTQARRVSTSRRSPRRRQAA